MGSRPSIVHYDFADIRYSSFYSAGFQLNSDAYGYDFRISRRLPGFLSHPGVAARWKEDAAQQMRLLYRFTSGVEDSYFCIDALDHNRNYHLPLLENVEFYFKVNYDPEVVPQTGGAAAQTAKIRPVLPFFPLRTHRQLGPFPRLSSSQPMRWDHRAVVRRFIDAPRVPSVAELRALRGARKTHDIFFVSAYYPDANHAPAMEFRYKVMEELDRQGISRGLYGFATRRELPQPFSRYALGWLSFKDYMRALSGARLAIYVRGMLDCLSFKFGEYLCLGLPVVGQTVANDRRELYALPRLDAQFAFDEPREIAAQAAALLARDAERRVLGQSNAGVFDIHLSPQAVTSGVLDVLGLRRSHPAS